ncbi:hypothetical protein LCGC14_2698640, partial [marine sediment metagenome]
TVKGLSKFYKKNDKKIHALKDVSFEVKKGEIFGIGGLVGSGRTELVRLIFGVDKKDSGELFYKGKNITPKSPVDAIKKGIGLLTENRRKNGLMVEAPIYENISLVKLIKSTGAFLKLKKEKNLGEGGYAVVYDPNQEHAPPEVSKQELVIPGKRWEATREGVEDYAYLYLLKQAIANASPKAAAKAKKLLDSCVKKVLKDENNPQLAEKAKKQIMSIWRNQLNKDLPTIRHSEDGSVNVVLAVYHPKIYAKNGSNSYIPAWTITNTEYYHKNSDEYLGWIDLEDLQYNKYA